MAKLDDAAPLDVGEVVTEHLRLAGEVVAWKDAIRELIVALPSVAYRDRVGDTQIRAEIAVYERAVERANKVLGDIARLGLEGRALAMREQQARALMAVLAASIGAELVDEEARRRVLSAVAAGLRDGGLTAIEAP